MTAVETLKHEHRVIEKVLDAIEREAAKASRGEPASSRLFADAIDFVRNFADRCHHAKEEGILFKAMAAKGVPVEHGPLGVMLAEHDGGRLLVRQAADALEAGDLSQAAAHLTDYSALLRQHIQREDNVLYAVAERVLSGAELARMAAEFERVEAGEMGEGTHERYREMAHRMADGTGY